MSRRMFPIFLLSILVLLLLYPNVVFSQMLPNNNSASEESIIIANPDAQSTFSQVPLENAREVLVRSYYLAPDRRFLLALVEINRFLTGSEQGKIQAKFSDGQWVITCGEDRIGVLPEFPDFPDLMTLLRNRVKILQQRHPVKMGRALPEMAQKSISEDLDKFLSPNTAAAIHRIDALWSAGVRHPFLVQAAARGLVNLVIQSLDDLEIGDQLPAKALASVALAEELAALPGRREECLLAYRLDYSTHAAAEGIKLPEMDAARLYVLHDDTRLRESASLDSGSVEAGYLWLLRLVELNQVNQVDQVLGWIVTRFRDRQFSLPLFKAGLDLDTFGMTPVLAGVLPRLVLLDLAREVEILPDLAEMAVRIRNEEINDQTLQEVVEKIRLIVGAETGRILGRFEYGLGILDKKYPGPFLDARTYQAFYKGYFFSPLYKQGIFRLDRLSSEEAAADFASLLGTAERGIAGDFRRWYGDLSRSKSGKLDAATLIADLTALPGYGAVMSERLLEEYGSYARYGDPETIRVMRSVIRSLDTRARHREILYNAAYTFLYDLNLRDRLLAGIVRINGFKRPELAAFHAHTTGDRKRLRELIDDPRTDLGGKLQSLKHLQSRKDYPSEEIRNCYRGLVGKHPEEWNCSSQFGEYLIDRGDYSEARKVYGDWLNLKVNTQGLESIEAATRIAAAFYKEGRYQEGWEAVKPVISSWKAGAMSRGARLLDKLGEISKSEELARAVADRYKDSLGNRLVLVEILWKHGKFEDAAEALRAFPKKIQAVDWQASVAPAFVEVFQDAPEERIEAAFSALSTKDFDPFVLSYLADRISRKGRNEAAYKIVSQLRARGTSDVLLAVDGYRYLKAWKDKDEALTWLATRIPPNFITQSSMIFFDRGEYDLLWDFIPHPEQSSSADFVWLLRAAASTKLGEKDPYREQLLANYKTDGAYYHRVGRHLMGLVPEDDIVPLATDPMKKTEISYYLGFKALMEGRMGEASDWFRVAMEIRWVRAGEYHWALGELYKIRNRILSPANRADP